MKSIFYRKKEFKKFEMELTSVLNKYSIDDECEMAEYEVAE